MKKLYTINKSKYMHLVTNYSINYVDIYHNNIIWKHINCNNIKFVTVNFNGRTQNNDLLESLKLIPIEDSILKKYNKYNKEFNSHSPFIDDCILSEIRSESLFSFFIINNDGKYIFMDNGNDKIILLYRYFDTQNMKLRYNLILCNDNNVYNKMLDRNKHMHIIDNIRSIGFNLYD